MPHNRMCCCTGLMFADKTTDTFFQFGSCSVDEPDIDASHSVKHCFPKQEEATRRRHDIHSDMMGNDSAAPDRPMFIVV